MSFTFHFTDYGHGGWKVVVVAGLLIVMQSLMLAGRYISRRLKETSLAADDYVLVLATVFTVGLCGLAIAFPRIAGVGSHVTGIEMTTPSEGTLAGHGFMAWMIVYGLSVMLAKCAILLLYIRVFTTCKRMFTATVYLIGFVVVAAGIANTFIAILQCSPQSFAWDKSNKGGICINVVAWARYMAIPNVITGAVMLVMPLPIVWRLNVNLSAKIALTATLLHGIVGFVASCARLSILFSTNAAQFSNNNLDNSLVWTIWTINEPANYIIAACLPTLRPIFLRILPSSFFILSKQRGTSNKPSTSSLKVSWPRGSLAPKFHLETRNFQTNSRITGPWSTRAEGWEADGGTGYWPDVEGGVPGRGGDQRRMVMGTLAPVTEEKKGMMESTTEVKPGEDF